MYPIDHLFVANDMKPFFLCIWYDAPVIGMLCIQFSFYFCNCSVSRYDNSTDYLFVANDMMYLSCSSVFGMMLVL